MSRHFSSFSRFGCFCHKRSLRRMCLFSCTNSHQFTPVHTSSHQFTPVQRSSRRRSFQCIGWIANKSSTDRPCLSPAFKTKQSEALSKRNKPDNQLRVLMMLGLHPSDKSNTLVGMSLHAAGKEDSHCSAVHGKPGQPTKHPWDQSHCQQGLGGCRTY